MRKLTLTAIIAGLSLIGCVGDKVKTRKPVETAEFSEATREDVLTGPGYQNRDYLAKERTKRKPRPFRPGPMGDPEADNIYEGR